MIIPLDIHILKIKLFHHIYLFYNPGFWTSDRLCFCLCVCPKYCVWSPPFLCVFLHPPSSVIIFTLPTIVHFCVPPMCTHTHTHAGTQLKRCLYLFQAAEWQWNSKSKARLWAEESCLWCRGADQGRTSFCEDDIRLDNVCFDQKAEAELAYELQAAKTKQRIKEENMQIKVRLNLAKIVDENPPVGYRAHAGDLYSGAGDPAQGEGAGQRGEEASWGREIQDGEVGRG